MTRVLKTFELLKEYLFAGDQSTLAGKKWLVNYQTVTGSCGTVQNNTLHIEAPDEEAARSQAENDLKNYYTNIDYTIVSVTEL